MIDERSFLLLLLFNLSAESLGFHPIVFSLAPGAKSARDSSASSESASSEEVFRNAPNDRTFFRFAGFDSPYMSAIRDSVQDPKEDNNPFIHIKRLPGKRMFKFGSRGPLQEAFDMSPDSSEELIRQGFDDKLLRLGRSYDKNYLRFGRSTKPFDQKSQTDINLKNKITLDCLHNSQTKDCFSHTGGDDETTNTNSFQSTLIKRTPNSRNFLRYGRNPLDLHFLRFGKRTKTADRV